MRVLATTQNHWTAQQWRTLLGASGAIEVVESRAASLDADVVVMAGIWAFERYGGRPLPGRAQILPNETGDGLPLWVAVPPHRPLVRQQGELRVHADYTSVSPAYFAVVESMREIKREFGDGVVVVLDLPLLGMDDPGDGQTPLSVARAVETALRE